MTRIAAGLECSVSHSGEKVVVAIARYPIGVDVQRIERELDIDEAAAQILTASELASFRQIPADDRLWGLLAYWTRKEAILKATGHGLRVGPRQISVSPSLQSPRLLEVEDASISPTGVDLHALNAGVGHVASLAAIGAHASRVIEFDAAEILSGYSCWRSIGRGAK